LPETQVWVPSFPFLEPRSKYVVINPSTDMLSGISLRWRVKARSS
jgi:hypothetical protein